MGFGAARCSGVGSVWKCGVNGEMFKRGFGWIGR